MNAETMPTRMVTSMPIGCLPGTSRRPRTPTTMPMRIAVMTPVMVICPPSALGVEVTYPRHPRNKRVRQSALSDSGHAISGRRRWASVSSNSPTSRMSAPSSRVRVFRSSLACSSLRSHGLAAVERRGRHAPAGGAVDQEARAAEAFEILERGQYRGSVEVDGSVDLIAWHLDPRRPHAGAVTGAVVTVHRTRSPTDRRVTSALPKTAPARSRSGAASLRADAHGLLGFPGAGGDAPTGFPVHQ